MSQRKDRIGIVIPYYNASRHILNVINKAKEYSNHIIVVDDCSPEKLPQEIFSSERVTIINLKENKGVGGATLIGFNYFGDKPNIRVIIKLDSDDQMDTSFIPQLSDEIFSGYEFAKGNRFRDFQALKKMPKIRRFGNFFLSFLSKIATGYWNIFDFNNGFFAISNDTFKKLDVNIIYHNYFFETSLISELYFHRVKIKEIPMPAIYGDEKSNMNLTKMPFLFSKNLVKLFLKRIIKSYFIFDFNIGSIYLIFGSLFMSVGILFGGYNWYKYSSKSLLTPVGTIMISVLLIILGFQLLLQLIQFDILKSPQNEK
jgi:hypothetical protein